MKPNTSTIIDPITAMGEYRRRRQWIYAVLYLSRLTDADRKRYEPNDARIVWL